MTVAISLHSEVAPDARARVIQDARDVCYDYAIDLTQYGKPVVILAGVLPGEELSDIEFHATPTVTWRHLRTGSTVIVDVEAWRPSTGELLCYKIALH